LLLAVPRGYGNAKKGKKSTRGKGTKTHFGGVAKMVLFKEGGISVVFFKGKGERSSGESRGGKGVGRN